MRLSRRTLLKGLVTSLFGAVTVPAYAFGFEPRYRLNVARYQPALPAWPAGFPLSIAVVADLHAGAPVMAPARIEEIVAATNALKPDLILLLGDYAAGHRFITRRVPPAEWAPLLSRLKAPLGVHAILGNHDWWDDPSAQATGKGPPAARRALEANGIPVYENDAIRLSKDGRDFWLLGLGDQLAFKRGDDQFEGVHDLAGTLGAVTGDAPAILLAHEPDIFPEVPDRIALTLSGHTHGGQVRLFGYSPIVPSAFGNRYAYGQIVEDDRHLIVSGGLGCSVLPVRCGVPPEIVLIELGA